MTQIFSWCKTVTAIDFNISLTIKPIQEFPSVVSGILFCGAQMFTTKSCEHPGDNFSSSNMSFFVPWFSQFPMKREKYPLNQVLNSQEITNNGKDCSHHREKALLLTLLKVPLPCTPTYFVMIACFPFGPTKVFNCNYTHLHSR